MQSSGRAAIVGIVSYRRGQMRVLQMWCKLWGVEAVILDMNDTVMTNSPVNHQNPVTHALIPLLEKRVVRMCVLGMPGSSKGKLVNWIQKTCKGILYASRSTTDELVGYKTTGNGRDDNLFVRTVCGMEDLICLSASR